MNRHQTLDVDVLSERVRKALDAARARLGLGPAVRTHSMRKTFARVMKRLLGDDMLALQKAMRHENLNSTLRYVDPDTDKVERALLADWGAQW